MYEFQRDATSLRRTFPPQGKEWNIHELEHGIRIGRDFHGWTEYRTAVRLETIGTNVSTVTIAAPAAGFLRYVYSCSAFFDGAPASLDLRIQTNTVVIAQGLTLGANNWVFLDRPIVLTENDNLNAVTSAAVGAANDLSIQALVIDLRETDYLSPV